MRAMTITCNIADFNSSDGLTPQQAYKLNYNFHQLLKLGLGTTQRDAQLYTVGVMGDESKARSDADDAINARIDALITMVKDTMHPVGSTYITFGNENPGNLFAGTWQKVAQGRMLIGAGVDNFTDPDHPYTYTVGATDGEKEVTLTAAQSGLPAHNHPEDEAGNHRHALSICKVSNGTGTTGNGPNYTNSVLLEFNYSWQSFKPNTEYDGKHAHTIKDNTAADATKAHNNMPPYVAVNIWKRVS